MHPPRFSLTRLHAGLWAVCISTLVGCAAPHSGTPGQPSAAAVTAVRLQNAAQATVERTLAQLEQNGVASNARIALVRPDTPNAFETLWHDLVTSELVRSGRRVTQNPDHPLKLSLGATVAGSAQGGSATEVLLTARTQLGDQIVSTDTQVQVLDRFDPALFQSATATPRLKVVNQ